MKKIRVFIIEDEKDTLNMLITYLKKNSFEVSGYALNGNDAIQIIKNNQSDIILTDIGLPGEFDGIETIEIIQQENDIPVIFITGFDSQDLIDRAKKIKYATYLHKPIDLNNLSAAIEIGLYQKNSDNIFINSISEAYSYNKIIYNNNNIPADYIIITVNDNFAKILGLDKKNICGRKASELYDLQNVELKNDFYNLLKIYSNLKPNGEKNEFERYSPITRKWYKIITYSLKNEYFITLRSDVTELKRKDKYLLEFYTSLQLIPSIVVITDVDGNFEFVNSAFERVTGYIIADVQGISTKILKSENYDPGYIKNLWDTIKSGNIWRGEFYNRKKNGELYYEFAIIGSIKNEAGEITNFIKTAEDITERKIVEKKLFASEKKYRTLIENLQEGFWQIDNNAKTVFVNKNLAKMLGYTVEEMLGKHLFCFMDTTDIDNAKNNLKRREKGIKEQHDFNFIKKDGTKINAHLETSPLYDDFGNYIGAIAGVIDITYRKQTEEQLLKHEKELQIKNELLIQINSRLKEKEKILIKRQLEIIKNAKMASLGQLVAGIAHEINNPNNFLSINIPVLKQYWEALKPILIDSLNKQPEKKLGKVSYTKITNEIEILIDELQDGSDRIKKIVSSLKDFSQQSVNYFKLISINIAIEKSLTIVKSGISKKTKNIILNLQNDLPLIKGDETKIMQVIINLLNNAADAINKKNDGYVKIETKLVEKNLVISISDNGCGIEADKMKYLMEPFYTTKAESGGTGLGMPIVYGIVKEHNAELCVLSSLNWGTKIIILIPYGEINPVINSEILLFESDESITKKYTLNFTDSGLNIISFCNFDFLLNYLYSENIINTIILNIETLSEDSIDFIIKYKNRNPWVKIILISEKEIIGHILLEYSFKNRIFSKISESLTELIFMIKDYML